MSGNVQFEMSFPPPRDDDRHQFERLILLQDQIWAPSIPIDTVWIATGLPENGAGDSDNQSSAFFRTPGIE